MDNIAPSTPKRPAGGSFSHISPNNAPPQSPASTSSVTSVAGSTSDHPHVRILVLGDDKVGKTSLISTLVSQHFSEKVPSVMHDVVIPAEENQENVITTIMDSPSNDAREMTSLLAHADAIILVYDISRPDTFQRIRTKWLPLVQKTNCKPVVLVRNKIDLRVGNASQQADGARELQKQVSTVLEEFKFVEACLECSAKAVLNIQPAFYYAQKAVMYPIAPLFNMEDSTIQPALEKILRRIFRLYDLDRDRILSDKELNAFQHDCFGVHLQPDDLEGLKKILTEELSDGVLPGRGILSKGFLHINKMFIEKNRPETIWKILRVFGYNEHLELVIPEEKLELPHFEHDQSIELSSSAVQFLTDLFYQYDRDHDGILDMNDILEIFSICPETPSTIPWDETDTPVLQDTELPGAMTLSVWLSQWSLLALLSVRKTLVYLYYLGFNGNLSGALEFTKRRSLLQNKRYINRKVVRCFVLGSPNCGKTSLIQSFLGKRFSDHYRPTRTARSVANAVQNSQGVEKYLVLSEFAETDIHLIVDNAIQDLCDVVCLLYDPCDAASFEYIRALQPLIPDHIPCVYVCTKCDKLPVDYATSENWREVSDHCSSLELDEPTVVSAKTSDKLTGKDTLLTILVDVAQYPEIARPVSETKRRMIQQQKQLQKYVLYNSLALSVIAVGVYIYRRRQHQ